MSRTTSRTHYTPAQKINAIQQVKDVVSAQGLTIQEACDTVGISYASFNEWRNKMPTLRREAATTTGTTTLPTASRGKTGMTMLGIPAQQQRLLNFAFIGLPGRLQKALIKFGQAREEVVQAAGEVEWTAGTVSV